jgi:hypothetical protein
MLALPAAEGVGFVWKSSPQHPQVAINHASDNANLPFFSPNSGDHL